jgi:hypothetical protein
MNLNASKPLAAMAICRVNRLSPRFPDMMDVMGFMREPVQSIDG